mmetsp:Transcript_9197/g.24126  ORF Transcript_9197/g.24126 Transcript_9197/m.24126 type:complete len:216 (-) Transcript_9197:580-1227(-)
MTSDSPLATARSSWPPKSAGARRQSLDGPKVLQKASSKKSEHAGSPYPQSFTYSTNLRSPATFDRSATTANAAACQKASCKEKRSFATKRSARQTRKGSSIKILAHQSTCRATLSGALSKPRPLASSSSSAVRRTAARMAAKSTDLGLGALRMRRWRSRRPPWKSRSSKRSGSWPPAAATPASTRSSIAPMVRSRRRVSCSGVPRSSRTGTRLCS